MAELGWHRQEAKWGGVDYQRVRWLRPAFSTQRGSVLGPDDARAIMPNRSYDDVEALWSCSDRCPPRSGWRM